MNTIQWHKQRQQCVGGSEAPALVGLGYKDQTPLSIWQEKVANAPILRPANERMILGTYLEPFIADRYSERMLTDFEPLMEGHHVRHPERRWQGCTPDRFASSPYAPERRLVQLKAIFSPPGEEWGEPLTDQIPERVIVQVTHEMGVTGIPVCDVAALFVGYGFEVYRVQFDRALYELLTTIQKAFWRFVEEREPPPADWSHPFAAKVIEALAKPIEGKVCNLGEIDLELARQYEQLGDNIRGDEEERKRVKRALCAAMGDCAIGRLPDGREVRRGTQNRKGYQVEPCTFETFKIHTPKKARL